jgi:hypothetical protein
MCMIAFVLIALVLSSFIFIHDALHTNSSEDILLQEGIHVYEGRRSGFESEKIPNAIDSLQRFLKSFKEGNEDGLLYAVQLYCYGLHPEYAPSKILGLRLINRLTMEDHFSQNLKMACKLIQEDVEIMAYDDIDARGYDSLPTNIITTFDDIVDYQLKNNIDLKHCTVNVLHRVERQVQVTSDDDAETNKQTEKVIEEPVIVVQNDSQNVHNHVVGNSCKKIIESLGESSSFVDNVKTFYEVIESLDIDKNVKDDASTVIASLTSDNHSKFNRSEQEVFSLVFNRILPDHNMLHIFIQNLASAIEYGAIVCSTGKITRMLSTFDGVDDSTPDIKPDWIVKQELANLAAKIRSEFLDTISENEVEAYNSGLSLKLSEQMLQSFMSESKKSYVDSNLLSQTALDFYLKDFVYAF